MDLPSKIEFIKLGIKNKNNQLVTLNLENEFGDEIKTETIPDKIDENENIIFSINNFFLGKSLKKQIFFTYHKNNDFFIEIEDNEYEIKDIEIININEEIKIDQSRIKLDDLISVKITDESVKSLKKIINKTKVYKEINLTKNNKLDILFQSLASFKNIDSSLLEKEAEYILDSIELIKHDLIYSPNPATRIKKGFFKNGNLYPVLNDNKNINMVPSVPINDKEITSKYNFYNLGLETDKNFPMGSCDLMNLLDCYSSTFNYRSRNKPGCYLRNCPSNKVTDESFYYYDTSKEEWDSEMEKTDFSFSNEYLERYKAKSNGIKLSFKEYNLLSKRGGIFNYSKTQSITIPYGLINNYQNISTKVKTTSDNILGNKYCLSLNQSILSGDDTEEIMSEDTNIIDIPLLSYRLKNGVNSDCFGYRYSNIQGVINRYDASINNINLDEEDEYNIPIYDSYFPSKRFIDGPKFIIVDVLSKDEIKGKVCDGTSNKMEVILKEKIGSGKSTEENWVIPERDYNKKVDYRTESIKYIDGENILLAGFIWEKIRDNYFINDIHENDKITVQSDYFIDNKVSFNPDYNSYLSDTININYTHYKTDNFKIENDQIKIGFNQYYLFRDYYNKKKLESSDIDTIVRNISPTLNDIIYTSNFINKKHLIFNLDNLQKLITYYNLDAYTLPSSSLNYNIIPLIKKNINNLILIEDSLNYNNTYLKQRYQKYKNWLKITIHQKSKQNKNNFKKYLLSSISKFSNREWNDFLNYMNIIDDDNCINPLILKLNKNLTIDILENSVDNRKIIVNLIQKLLELSFPSKSLSTNWSKQVVLQANKAVKGYSREVYQNNLPLLNYTPGINIHTRINTYDKINLRFLSILDRHRDKGSILLTSIQKEVYKPILEKIKLGDIENKIKQIVLKKNKNIKNKIGFGLECNNNKYSIRKEYDSLTELQKDNNREIESNISTLSISYGIFIDILNNFLKKGIYFDKTNSIQDFPKIFELLTIQIQDKFPQFTSDDINKELNQIQNIITRQGILNDKEIKKLKTPIKNGDFCRLFKKGKYFIYQRENNQWHLVDNDLPLKENPDICESLNKDCIYYDQKCQDINLYITDNENENLDLKLEINNNILNLKKTNYKKILSNQVKVEEQFSLIRKNKHNQGVRSIYSHKKTKKTKIDIDLLKLSHILYLKDDGVKLPYDKITEDFYQKNTELINYDTWLTLDNTNLDFRNYLGKASKEQTLLLNYKNILKNKLLEKDLDKRNKSLYQIIQQYGYFYKDSKFIYWDISPKLDNDTLFFYKMCCSHNYISCQSFYKSRDSKENIQKKLVDLYGRQDENCITCKYCGEILENTNITDQLVFDEESRLVSNIESSLSIEEQSAEINFHKKYSSQIKKYYDNFILRYINNYWILLPQLENNDISFILDYYNVIEKNNHKRFSDIDKYLDFMTNIWDGKKDGVIFPNSIFLGKEEDIYLEILKTRFPNNVYINKNTKTKKDIDKLAFYLKEIAPINDKSCQDFGYQKGSVRYNLCLKLRELFKKERGNKKVELQNKNINNGLKEITRELDVNFFMYKNIIRQNLIFKDFKNKDSKIKNINKLLDFINEYKINLDSFDVNKFLNNISVLNTSILTNIFNLILLKKSYQHFQDYHLKIGLLSRFIFILFTAVHPNYILESTGSEKTGRLFLPGNLSFNRDNMELSFVCDNHTLNNLFSDEQKILIENFVNLLKSELENNWKIPIFGDEKELSGEKSQIKSRIYKYLLNFFCDRNNKELILERFYYEQDLNNIIRENNEWTSFRPPFYRIEKANSTGLGIMKLVGNYISRLPYYKNNIKLNKIFCAGIYLLKYTYYSSIDNSHLNKLILESKNKYQLQDHYGKFYNIKTSIYTDDIDSNFFDLKNKNRNLLVNIITKFYHLFSFSESSQGKRRIYQEFNLNDTKIIDFINNKSTEKLALINDEQLPLIDDEKFNKLLRNHFYQYQSIRIDLTSNQTEIEINYYINQLVNDKTDDKLIEIIKTMKNFMSDKNSLYISDKKANNPETYLSLPNKMIFYNILKKFYTNLSQIIESFSNFGDAGGVFIDLKKYYLGVLDKINLLITDKTLSEDELELLKKYEIPNKITIIDSELLQKVNLFIWDKDITDSYNDTFGNIISEYNENINRFLNNHYKIILGDYQYNLDQKTIQEIDNITNNLIINQIYPETEIDKVKQFILENYSINDLEPLMLKTYPNINNKILEDYSYHLFNNYFYHKVVYNKNNLIKIISTNNISKLLPFDIINNIEILVNLINYDNNLYSPIFITDICKIYYSLFTVLLNYLVNNFPENYKLEIDNILNNLIDSYHINHTTEKEIKELLDNNIIKKNKENIEKTKGADASVRDTHLISRELGLGNYSQLNISDLPDSIDSMDFSNQEKEYQSGDLINREDLGNQQIIDEGNEDMLNDFANQQEVEEQYEMENFNETELDDYED